MDLIFDIKHLIASINPEAWYWMYMIDDEFKNYASSLKGIKEFKKIHTQIIINKYCTKYILFGAGHREDGPSVIWANGTLEWWLNGKRHREDGPAVKWLDGSEEWFFNGKLHRENGPAIVKNGTQEWWVNGKMHREDGPAIIWSDGTQSCFNRTPQGI